LRNKGRRTPRVESDRLRRPLTRNTSGVGNTAMTLDPKNSLHQQCQSAMGPALGDLYFLLWQELSWLNFTHTEFKQLFADRSDHIELMKRYGRDFFSLVERLLWHDLFLGLCRIADPPRSVGKDNLTVQRVPPLISDPSLRADVQLLVESAASRTAFARDWRNRQIAHRDLLKSMDPVLHPLSPATRQDLDDSMLALEKVMNAVQLPFLNSTTSFGVIQAERGARELMYHLRRLDRVEPQPGPDAEPAPPAAG
jgi:hypothetical protein